MYLYCCAAQNEINFCRLPWSRSRSKTFLFGFPPLFNGVLRAMSVSKGVMLSPLASAPAADSSATCCLFLKLLKMVCFSAMRSRKYSTVFSSHRVPPIPHEVSSAHNNPFLAWLFSLFSYFCRPYYSRCQNSVEISYKRFEDTSFA